MREEGVSIGDVLDNQGREAVNEEAVYVASNCFINHGE
jgi:hypothetical protein